MKLLSAILALPILSVTLLAGCDHDRRETTYYYEQPREYHWRTGHDYDRWDRGHIRIEASDRDYDRRW